MRTLFLSVLAVCLAPLAALAEDRPAELADLLDRMAEGGKRRFIFDEQSASRFREEKVRLIPAAAESDASFATGIEILKTAKLALVAVEAGALPTWKVVWTERAREEVLRTYESLAALPATNEYCAFQVKLKYLRARDVLSLLQAILSDPRNVTVVEAGETLILSDFAQMLRGAMQVVTAADVAPTEGVAWRVTVAAIEASDGGDGSCPEAFKDAGLPAATGKKTFRLMTDGCVSVMTGGPATKSSGSARVALVLGPEGGLDVVMSVNRDTAGAPMLDTVEARGKDGALAGMTLSARVALKEGAWVVAGTVPVKDAPKAVVVLLRVERTK